MMKYFSFLSIICLLLVSCQKQLPQLPANKSNTVDAVGNGLLKINEELILREDSLLADFVSKSDSDFVKDKLGFWYKMNFKTNLATLKVDDKCVVDYSVYTLDNELLLRKKEQIVIGKNQIVNGAEELLKQMHKGEKATLILPWYLAYGMKGDAENIPPYTSVIIYLHLLE